MFITVDDPGAILWNEELR